MCNYLKHLLKIKYCFSVGIVLQKLLSKDRRKHGTGTIVSNLKKSNKHYRSLPVVWRNIVGENKSFYN